MEQTSYRTASILAYVNVILMVVVMILTELDLWAAVPFVLLKAGVMFYLFYCLYGVFSALFDLSKFRIFIKGMAVVFSISIALIFMYSVLRYTFGDRQLIESIHSLFGYNNFLSCAFGVFAMVTGHGTLTLPFFSVLMVFLTIRLFFTFYRQLDKKYLLLLVSLFLWSVLSLQFIQSDFAIIPELTVYVLMGIIFLKPVPEVEFV